MSQPDKQAHDGQVIQEKERQRFLKVEKGELNLPQQTGPYLPAQEGENAEGGNRRSRRPENRAFPGKAFLKGASTTDQCSPRCRLISTRPQ